MHVTRQQRNLTVRRTCLPLKELLEQFIATRNEMLRAPAIADIIRESLGKGCEELHEPARMVGNRDGGDDEEGFHIGIRAGEILPQFFPLLFTHHPTGLIVTRLEDRARRIQRFRSERCRKTGVTRSLRRGCGRAGIRRRRASPLETCVCRAGFPAAAIPSY